MGFFIPILGTIIKSVITGFAISKAVSWLAPKPELPEFTQEAEAQGVLVNKQSNNANIPVIYGTRKVGGTRVFLETSGTERSRGRIICRTITDYLDDVSTNYVDPVQIQAGAPAGLGQVAVDLADRNIPTIPVFSDPGAPRGDPTDNDNYFFVMVYYHIPLVAKGNNGSFGGGRKKGKGRLFGGKKRCIDF